MAAPFPPTDAVPDKLRFSAIVKLQHNGGSEGMTQWRVFDPPLSYNSVRKQKIDMWRYTGCPYSAPAVLPNEAAGLFVLDLRYRLWDRRIETPKSTMMWTIPVHGGWFNPMIPGLLNVGIKPIIFIGERGSRRFRGTIPCYEALGFQKESDMVAAEVILDDLLPPR